MRYFTNIQLHTDTCGTFFIHWFINVLFYLFLNHIIYLTSVSVAQNKQLQMTDKQLTGNGAKRSGSGFFWGGGFYPSGKVEGHLENLSCCSRFSGRDLDSGCRE
jgi:hypothetical protein